jgi:hypothetical protein
MIRSNPEGEERHAAGRDGDKRFPAEEKLLECQSSSPGVELARRGCFCWSR